MRILLLLLCHLLSLAYVSAYVLVGGAGPVVYGNANNNNNQGDKVYSGYVHNNADHLHNNPNNIPHDHGPNEGHGTINPHEHGNVPREGHANPGGGGGGTINPHAHDNIHNDGHGTINPHEHGNVPNDDGHASMCARSKHPDICSSAIHSHPVAHPDNISFLMALTDAIIDSTKSTRRQTNSAASFGQVTGRGQEVVNDCMKNYDDALYDLETAKMAIKRKDKGLAGHKFRDAVVKYGTCERALMEMPGAGQFAQQDVRLVKMAENCLSILDLI